MNARKLHFVLALTCGLLALVGTLALLWTMSSGPPIAQAQSVARPSPSHAIAATAAVTRYVSSFVDSDTGDCTSPSAPCKTIQYAVDQAASGDEIHIATMDNTDLATYTDASADVNVITLNKSLTLRGGYVYVHTTVPPVNTWAPGLIPAPVDGEHARRPLHVSGDITPSLELLAFINGSATQGGNVYIEDARVRFVATPIMSGAATYGGGLYLKDCSISFNPGDVTWENALGLGGLIPVRNNTAQYGGGVYIESGTPVLAGVAVISNAATADGGGFYLYGGQPVIAGGLVLENQAGNRGGGFFLGNSPARIAGVAVYSNTAADGAGFYLDGPFAFSENRIPIIANSYVRHNRTTGSQGGGFYFHQTIAGLVNNVIADNQASDGAAMYLWASSPQLFHNTIAQNTGSTGVYLTNKPGQVWPPIIPIPSRPSFTNTIVSTHTTGLYVADTGLSGILQNQARLEGTLWWGNGNDTGGPGPVVHTTDVYSDPLFTCTGDPPDCPNPYHVLTDSHAIDAGVPVALAIPGSDLFVDIDLQLRPSGDGYDIGADEVVSDTYSVWFVPPVSAEAAEPGQTVTHTHQLMNTGLETDTYDLNVLSSYSNWVTLLADTVITLSAQTSETVQLQVTAPDTATNDMRETTRITATSRADADRQATALDVTAVITGDVTDLSVGKWADVEDAVEPGEALRFTIVVTNAGPLTDTLVVTLTDTAVPTRAISAWSLPAGCTGVITTGTAVCTRTLTGGSVPVSESLTLVITTTDTYTGPLVNRVSASADVIDPHPANNVAYATVGLTTPVCIPLENVVIHGPQNWISDTAATFRANVSPPLATPPITYTWWPQPDGSAVLPGRSVATYTWHTTGTKTITVTATNCDGAGQATDVHTITIYGPDVSLVDLIVDKRADVTTTQTGGTVHYTIAITKSGSLTGTLAVTLTDTIVPTSALTMLRWPDNCTGTLATGVITCTWDLPGAIPLITRTFTIAVTTTNVYSGLLNNTVIVGAAALDPDYANNEAQATVQVSTSTPPGWSIYLPLVLRSD